MLLGIPGDNTYANFAEANRVFWRQTIVPLVLRVALPVETAELRCQIHRMAGQVQGVHQQTRHAAVAGRGWMVGRLQRRIKRNAHGSL